MKKRRGSSRAGRKTGSTSSASKKDEAVVETSTQETQPTQPTQEAEEATVKVESESAEEVKNEDEVKEDQAEKEEEEAKPDSPTHPKSQNEDAKEDQEEEDKEEAKEDQLVVKEETKPDSATRLEKGKSASKNDEAQGGASSSQPELRRGKRRRSTGNETEKKPTPRAKRARTTTTKPQEAEPEYFKDKRNLEDLWKDAFPVGTEWDQQDALYEFNWDFKNLEEALEEGGMLHGKKVYVFAQLVPHNNKNKTVLVPAVICIDSSIPPSDKIGVASAQGEVEEIIPMKDMKMAWVPYIPLEKRDRPVDRMNLPIFILGCTQRRSALKHLKEDRAKKFNYCLPYINNPFKEDESEQSTVVQITFPSEPPVVCEYDWETDKLEEFTDDLIKKETLLMDQKDEFNEFVKEQIDKAKAASKEARDEATEGMSEETKEAYKAMKLYKFYPLPSPDTPDVAGITKSSVINKYFGKAHEVF